MLLFYFITVAVSIPMLPWLRCDRVIITKGRHYQMLGIKLIQFPITLMVISRKFRATVAEPATLLPPSWPINALSLSRRALLLIFFLKRLTPRST